MSHALPTIPPGRRQEHCYSQVTTWLVGWFGWVEVVLLPRQWTEKELQANRQFPNYYPRQTGGDGGGVGDDFRKLFGIVIVDIDIIIGDERNSEQETGRRLTGQGLALLPRNCYYYSLCLPILHTVITD